ncbi:MAG TPA: OmpA family protein [Stellaceae bacterium]|jgi:outer membrane protein OmpA-like peptidoglycan-associated protein
MGKARSCRHDAGANAGRAALRLAAAALLAGLAACSPVAAYRNLVGTAKDDPNPATTPNTKNLTAGEAADYPNLATVPEPPTQALSTAQLDKLTQSLVADRTNAKYTSERLQAGFDQSAGSVPPPPPPPAAAASSAKPANGGAAAPAPPPPGAIAAAGGKSKTPPPGAATGLRKSGQPPEPGPMESSLQPPQIPTSPNPQQYEPAPPPPRELSLPAGSARAGAPPGPAHLPPPPAPAPLPAAIGSAKFEPPPPPPVLPPATPTRMAAAGAPGKRTAPRPADTPVAEVDFVAGSTALDAAGRQELGKIVPLYRRDPGKVRIIGYAGVGSGAVEQLNSFQTALDRAHAVAAALEKAGIPAGQILVEAAPAGADSGQGRAEILFER